MTITRLCIELQAELTRDKTADRWQTDRLLAELHTTHAAHLQDVIRTELARFRSGRTNILRHWLVDLEEIERCERRPLVFLPAQQSMVGAP